jgi:hypothetical protein
MRVSWEAGTHCFGERVSRVQSGQHVPCPGLGHLRVGAYGERARTASREREGLVSLLCSLHHLVGDGQGLGRASDTHHATRPSMSCVDNRARSPGAGKDRRRPRGAPPHRRHKAGRHRRSLHARRWHRSRRAVCRGVDVPDCCFYYFRPAHYRFAARVGLHRAAGKSVNHALLQLLLEASF